MDATPARINMWVSFRSAGIRDWARGMGIPLRCIEKTHLPFGEPVLMDLASLDEMYDLLMQEENEEMVGEFAGRGSVILIVPSGTAFYPNNIAFFERVSAIIPEGDFESLLTALCPYQFKGYWTKSIKRGDPPRGYPYKSRYSYLDFNFTPRELSHLAGCTACKSQVEARICAFELGLAQSKTRLEEELFSRNLAHQVGSELFALVMNLDDTQAAGHDPETCPFCRDRARTEREEASRRQSPLPN